MERSTSLQRCMNLFIIYHKFPWNPPTMSQLLSRLSARLHCHWTPRRCQHRPVPRSGDALCWLMTYFFKYRYDAQDSMKDSVDVGVIKTPSPKGRGLVSISYFINCTHECCCFISWRCVSTYSHPREACPVRGKDNLSCMNGDIYNLYIVSIDYFWGACPTIWLCQQATKQRLAKLEALQD